MKKFFYRIAYFLLVIPFQSFAAGTATSATTGSAGGGSTSAIRSILPKKEHIVGNLPDGDAATHFLPRFIDIIIKSAYTVSVGFMIVAAFLYFYAHGDEGETTKAKNMFIYAIVGFLVITISYAIVEGVTQIEWNFN